MSDFSTLISLFSAVLSLIAIAVSVFTFYKSHTLNHDIAVQTHLNDYKQAIKQIWLQSKPVVEQMDSILKGEYELNEIGRKLDALTSKSEYADNRPLRHTFYDLHSFCIEELEPEFDSEKLNYSRKINSLLDISLDIKPFLKTGKFGKRVTFDYLTTSAKKLCGIVEADEVFVPESFKGSRHVTVQRDGIDYLNETIVP